MNTSLSLFLPLSISDHWVLPLLFLCVQAIKEQVNESRKKCIRIYMPANCRLEEKFYHLTSEPERILEPPVFVVLPFILSVVLCNMERESIVSNCVCVCTETRIRH